MKLIISLFALLCFSICLNAQEVDREVKIDKVMTKHWGDSTFMYYVGGKFLQYGFEKLAPSVKDDTLLKERERELNSLIFSWSKGSVKEVQKILQDKEEFGLLVFEVYFDRDGKAVGGTLMMSANVFNILTKKEVIKIYHRMMNRIYETRYYRFDEQDKLGSMWGFLIRPADYLAPVK